MAGRIARIYKNCETLDDGNPNPKYQADKPMCWMEYFEAETGTFVVAEGESTLYKSHGIADELAVQMRAEGKHGFVFGYSCPATLPPPPSITHPYGEGKPPHREPREAHQNVQSDPSKLHCIRCYRKVAQISERGFCRKCERESLDIAEETASTAPHKKLFGYDD